MKNFLLSIATAAMFWIGNAPSAKAVVLDTSDPDFKLWLKADVGVEEAVGDAAENGDAIVRWLDQSGKNNHVTGGGASSPTFVGSEGALNNQPVVSFDGGDLLANALNPSFGFTVFGVVEHEGGAGNAVRAWFGGGANRVAFGLNASHPATPINSFWAWTPNAASTYGLTGSIDTNWNLHVYTVPSSTETAWTWYDNGTNTGAADLTSGTPLDYSTGIRIGQSGFSTENWTGDIAEVIVFDRVLTFTEINEVGYYLEQKYALTTAFVPEPGTTCLLVIGLAGCACARRRVR